MVSRGYSVAASPKIITELPEFQVHHANIWFRCHWPITTCQCHDYKTVSQHVDMDAPCQRVTINTSLNCRVTSSWTNRRKTIERWAGRTIKATYPQSEPSSCGIRTRSSGERTTSDVDATASYSAAASAARGDWEPPRPRLPVQRCCFLAALNRRQTRGAHAQSDHTPNHNWTLKIGPNCSCGTIVVTFVVRQQTAAGPIAMHYTLSAIGLNIGLVQGGFQHLQWSTNLVKSSQMANHFK